MSQSCAQNLERQMSVGVMGSEANMSELSSADILKSVGKSECAQMTHDIIWPAVRLALDHSPGLELDAFVKKVLYHVTAAVRDSFREIFPDEDSLTKFVAVLTKEVAIEIMASPRFHEPPQMSAPPRE